MECVFCRIISGDIPSYKIYEDDNVMAFLDIAPVSPGHALIIPKKHIANMEEMDDEVLHQVMYVVKKVGKAIKDGLGVEGYNIILNNGKVAGQVVNHFHFHIIPRKDGDGHALWKQGKYEGKEASDVITKIRAVLNK